MRWKTTASIVKGVRVMPGNVITDAEKNHPKLRDIIATGNAAFIMSKGEEQAYLNVLRGTPDITKKDGDK